MFERESNLYFAAGAEKHPELMGTLLGRKVTPQDAFILGAQLRVQPFDKLPAQVQEILDPVWGSSFKDVVVTPKMENGRLQTGYILRGSLYELEDETDLEVLKAWNIDPLWRQLACVRPHIVNGYQVKALIHMGWDQTLEPISPAEHYNFFPNGIERVIDVARRVRESVINPK